MQGEQPLISIVIPVYNVEEYLVRCLESVIKQTYTNLEIIVVDDGSTDNSGRICDEYKEKDERIKVIHKLNGGLSDARNFGINVTRGEYIAFIDSDDWVSLDYINCLYSIIEKDDYDIAICDFIRRKGKDKVNKRSREKLEIYCNKEAIRELLYQRISSSAWAKLFKRDLWKDIQFEVGKLYEDVIPIYLIFQQSKKIIKTNQCSYYYFYREGSIVTQKFSINKMDYVDNCKKLFGYVKTAYPEYENAAISRLFWAEVHVLVHMENPVDYPEIYKRLENNIKKHRWKTLRDRKNKLKVRGVAVLSFLGYKWMRKVYVLTG